MTTRGPTRGSIFTRRKVVEIQPLLRWSEPLLVQHHLVLPRAKFPVLHGRPLSLVPAHVASRRSAVSARPDTFGGDRKPQQPNHEMRVSVIYSPPTATRATCHVAHRMHSRPVPACISCLCAWHASGGRLETRRGVRLHSARHERSGNRSMAFNRSAVCHGIVTLQASL